MTANRLLSIAIKAKNNAYVPYSGFRVGAALLDSNNQVYSGCNIENVSFGATNCAERTAIFNAVSQGSRNFEMLAIASDSDDFIYPCGICRQVIVEFEIKRIIVSKKDGAFLEYSLNDIMPYAFKTFKLNEHS